MIEVLISVVVFGICAGATAWCLKGLTDRYWTDKIDLYWENHQLSWQRKLDEIVFEREKLGEELVDVTSIRLAVFEQNFAAALARHHIMLTELRAIHEIEDEDEADSDKQLLDDLKPKSG